jgi:tetratricopeptide (TPR) repeat protein
MSPPKILFLGANGRDTTRLRLGAEVRDIRRELETAGAADAFHITAELAVRPVDLQRLLLLHEPNLIHFSGHGLNPDPEKTTTTNGGSSTREFTASEPTSFASFTGGLLLENDVGAAVAVRPDVFADLLAIVKRDVPLRCVVLNACFSAAQAAAIAEHVDCVVGTTRAIEDDSAVAFATAFYRAISHGKSIGTAFDLGRNEIGLRGLPGQDVLRLYLRSGVKPDRIFLQNDPKSSPYSPENVAKLDEKKFAPHWAHVLEPAQHFQGRERLREELRAWLTNESDTTRIVAVCAIGGTGKTALVDRVLRDWLETKDTADKKLSGGVFVWSFYENDRVDDFLGEACRYFIGDSGEIGGRSARLSAALKDGRPHLLVLDGLETVQAEQGPGRAKGEILDAAFRVLIRQIAARQLGQTRTLVTSRFPVCDVASWQGEGYRQVDLDDLDPLAARAILRAWGVRGNDGTLDALAQRVGWHALSVRVMGAFLKNYADGDAKEGLGLDLEVMTKEAVDADRKAVKLDKLLGYVSMRMAPEEREVMARLSIFPRGIGVDLLYVLVESGGDIAGVLAGSTEKRIVLLLRRLVTQGFAFSYGEANHCVYTAHPFLRDHFKKLIGIKTEDVHEVLRQKLAPSLQLRPKELPRDTETLDRLEALIEHTRLSGKPVAAFELYWYGMGHSNHLTSTLGEYRRGMRIVEAFSENGSPRHCAPSMPARFRAALVTSWGHYADYLGDLPLAKSCIEEAIDIQRRASQERNVWAGFQQLAGLEFAMGRPLSMAERAQEGLEQATTAKDETGMMMCHTYLGTAAFLIGEIANARRHFVKATFIECRPLYAGRGVLEADFRRRVGEQALGMEQSQQNLAICEYRQWNDLVAVVHTTLGHFVLQSECSEAQRHLAKSRAWARKGDLEVTLRAHRLAAEIELHENHPELAHAEASEGLLLAETHGYGLYAIDLLLLLARACLASSRPSESFRHAKLALDRSTDSECGYVWGEADALHLLGLSLRDLGQRDQARERFEQAASVRARIEHPDAEDSRTQAMALAEE